MYVLHMYINRANPDKENCEGLLDYSQWLTDAFEGRWTLIIFVPEESFKEFCSAFIVDPGSALCSWGKKALKSQPRFA